MKYTKGPYRIGKGGSIVSDTPVTEVNSNECLEFYGGHCICESLTKANAERIIACFNACQGITTEALEAGVISAGIDALNDKFLDQVKPFSIHEPFPSLISFGGVDIWEDSDGK